MNIMDILDCSIADGEGVRIALYVSGCDHKCKGCHNPESWDCNAGTLFTEDKKQTLFNLVQRPYIDGITLTGGDPLHKCNIKETTALCKEFKEKFPNKTIWLYTGSVYEDIKDMEIMKYIDTLVDGEFRIEERDITLPFRGSKNQRIIKMEDNK